MHGKSRLIYFIEYSWLFILLLFASLVYLKQEFIDLAFNSDIFSSLLITKDLLFQHGHYKDWILPPAHHFFPDLFISAFVYSIVKNVYLYFLIIVWICVILIYLGVKLIYCQFFSVKKSIFFALMATSSLFLLSFSDYSSNNLFNHYPYLIVTVPFMHVGEFLAGLFFIGIQINLINKDKLTYKNYILAGISSFIVLACSLSDLLFLIQFVSPIFFIYSFFVLTRRVKFYRYLLLTSFVIFPAILAVLLTKILILDDTSKRYLLAISSPLLTKVSFSLINVQFIAFINMLKTSINLLIKIILGIFYLVLILILSNQLFFKDKKNIKNCSDKKLFLSLFIFLSVLFSIAVQFYSVNVTYVTFRYSLPLFYFPVLLFFFPVAYLNSELLTSKILNYLTGLFFIYIIVSLLVFINKPGFKLHRSYYPQYVHCIDKALRGYLHNGIAEYWKADYITVLSKENVEVAPMSENLTPFLWLVSKNRFQKSINFVILDTVELPSSIKTDLVYLRYGMPDKVVVCKPVKILIYSKAMTIN